MNFNGNLPTGNAMRPMPRFRRRATTVIALILAANAVAWLAAWLIFGGNAVLMGSAVMAFSLGLRHAVDADHIAAIDNATRKLMHDGKRPVTVGLWFSLGHSTIVIALSLALVLSAAGMRHLFATLAVLGATFGMVSSCLVLFLLAIMNAWVLLGLIRTFRAVRRGRLQLSDDTSLPLPRGPLGRLAGRLMRLVSSSWHLYPLGLVFGLGFDTATEIGLLGLSAAAAVHGLGLWTIMIFPALFTGGMSLIDTADSILMLNIYSWSYVRPLRKLYYNLTVTAISVAVAVLVGTMEVLNVVQGHLGLNGPFWRAVGLMGRNFGLMGYVVIAVFALSWISSLAIYRLRGFDNLDESQ